MLPSPLIWSFTPETVELMFKGPVIVSPGIFTKLPTAPPAFVMSVELSVTAPARPLKLVTPPEPAGPCGPCGPCGPGLPATLAARCCPANPSSPAALAFPATLAARSARLDPLDLALPLDPLDPPARSRQGRTQPTRSRPKPSPCRSSHRSTRRRSCSPSAVAPPHWEPNL